MDFSLFGIALVSLVAVAIMVGLIVWATSKAVQADLRYRVERNEQFDALPINPLPPTLVLMLFIGLIALTWLMWGQWNSDWLAPLICADLGTAWWAMMYRDIFVSSRAKDENESRERRERYELELQEQQTALAKEQEEARQLKENAKREADERTRAKADAERIKALAIRDAKRISTPIVLKSMPEISKFLRDAQLVGTHQGRVLTVKFLACTDGRVGFEWELQYDGPTELEVVGYLDTQIMFRSYGANRHVEQLVRGRRHVAKFEVYDGSQQREPFLSFAIRVPTQKQWLSRVDEQGRLIAPGEKPAETPENRWRLAFKEAYEKERELNDVETQLIAEIDESDFDTETKQHRIGRIQAIRAQVENG